MGDTTSNRGYRKPLSTDDPVDLTSFWRNMADDIDDDVALILGQRGNPAVPVTTSSNGTVTSGTTETRDAVLGSYTFTALAGVRYRAMLSGVALFGGSTSLGDRFTINIRNGGSSTPTASSTLVATLPVTLIGNAFLADSGHVVTGTFIPGAGTATLGVFVVRVSGTGTVTPVFAREFWAEAIGTV